MYFHGNLKAERVPFVLVARGYAMAQKVEHNIFVSITATLVLLTL